MREPDAGKWVLRLCRIVGIGLVVGVLLWSSRALSIVTAGLALLTGASADSALACRFAVAGLRRRFDALESREAAEQELSRSYAEENKKLKASQQSLQDAAGNLEAANVRMEAAARRFEELFQGLQIACFGYDSTGAIFEWNRASEEMFDAEESGLFHLNLYDLICPSGAKGKLEQIVESVFKGESFQGVHFERQAGEETFHLLCSTFPVHGPNEQVLGAIFSCVDLTPQKRYEKQIEEQLVRINEYSSEIEQQKWELQEANARLAALASTDGLTGLVNHRAFQEALARDVRRALRDGSPLSVVLLDIDHFKKYNDSFGHPAGDALLKQFARVLLSCARESDLAARYGGEEFILILPSTDLESSVIAAERVRSAIESATWENRQVTASLGIATLSADCCTPDQLIASADKALYASKEFGRNRATHCSALADQALNAA